MRLVCPDDSAGTSCYLGRKGPYRWPDSLVASLNMPKGEATVRLIGAREQDSFGGVITAARKATLKKHSPCYASVRSAVSERRVLGEAGWGVVGRPGHQAGRV